MADGHGGARPGAGRRPKAEKYETQFAAADQRWVDKLPVVQETLEKLAKGGLKRITKKFMPAVLVLTKEVRYDASDNPKNVDVPAFPDEDPKKLICVQEVVETLAPDRAANIYILDRILGKPTQSVEMSGPDGGDIPLPTHDLSRLTTDELLAMRGMLKKTAHDPSNPSGSSSAELDGGGSGAGAS